MKRLATFISLTIIFGLQLKTDAQITWNFNTAGSGAVSTTPALPASITAASAITQVNSTITAAASIFAAGTPASSGYSGASGTNNANFIAKTGVLNTASSTYLQFSITPAANNWVNITNINWGNFSQSTTGPTAFAIYTSVNNYATPVFVTSTAIPANSTWSKVNTATSGTAMSPINSLTGTAITIRIYAYGGVGVTPTGTATANANWRVDDIKVTATAQTGTVGQIPKYNGTNLFSNSVINESIAGNIGIGLTSATEKLDVNGKIKATGLLIPTDAGVNKVLTSDASGNATWQLPAGSTNYWTLAGNGLDISNNNTGNVGIGTLAVPNYKLAIADAARISSIGNDYRTQLSFDGYSSVGQLGGGAGFYMGTGIKPSTTFNALEKTSADNAHFFYTRYDRGLEFHTGVTGAIGSVFSDDQNLRMIIKDGGNVGIGTSNPTEKLSVNGNIWSSGYAKFDAQSVFQVPTVKIGFDGTNYEAMHITGNSIGAPVIKMDNIVYAIENGKGIIDINANNTYMYGSNGSGAALKYTVSQFNPISTSNWGVYMDLQNSSTGSQNSIFPYYAKVKTANGNAYGYYANATINSGGTGKAYAFYAENGMSYFSGNVGLGTETPTEKLEVNGGNIYTNGKILINQANTSAVAPYALAVNGSAIFTKATVKLNINWPDYVFEQSYKLPSLADLEQYIQKNKHLPEIPSADDVKKNGIDLGNNQTLLLKKVEELTLYVIEQNKKIELLQAEKEKIALLQSQIDELKKLMQEQKK